MNLAGRDVHHRLAGEFDRQVLLRPPGAVQRLQPQKTPDAVQRMYDEVAGVEIEEAVDRARGRDAPQRPPLAKAMEQLVMRHVCRLLRGRSLPPFCRMPPLKPAVQHADGGMQVRGPLRQLVQQFDEPLLLGRIVT